MKPPEKFGDEFVFERLSMPTADGRRLSCHQACVCIAPKKDEEATLIFAWQIVRDLADWMLEEFTSAPNEERFQIIVGWSQKVRRHQGQIFKIWGFKDGIRKIASTESYRGYAKETGNTQVPMPRWEKDVFQKKEPNQAPEPTAPSGRGSS